MSGRRRRDPLPAIPESVHHRNSVDGPPGAAGPALATAAPAADILRGVPVELFDTHTPLAPLRAEILQRIAEVVDDSRFILGPNVSAFEREFADYVGASDAIGVANGTDAITIALRAMGVGPGDEVIVPSFTFYASAEAIPPTGARRNCSPSCRASAPPPSTCAGPSG